MKEEDLIEEAKKAKSVDELILDAERDGIELTKDDAEKVFEELHKTGELSDDEIENVAGGGGCISHLPIFRHIFTIGSSAFKTLKEKESEKKS